MAAFCRRASPAVLVVLCALAIYGCDEDDQKQRQQQQQEREQLQKRLEEAQRQRDQDRRVLETRRDEAQSDTSASIAIWLATVFALLVAVLLVARERRKRRILERIVRLQMSAEREPPDE